ncbi:MAG: hypothetical protein Q9198_004967, partial [Flavoplaca austrocitrina]
MAPRKVSKEKSPSNGVKAASSTNRRLRVRPGDANPQPSSTQQTTPSMNTELLDAYKYLRTSDPSTDPFFPSVYTEIQSLINGLASAKELFDISVYNDVKAMLRVHGEHVKDHPRRSLPLLKRFDGSPPSSSSSRPSKVFTDDLAYEGPSSASTAASSPFKKHIKTAEEQEQEHPWQEGELLVFEPRPFGSKGPGYRHPTPKAVMGFDPAMGFGRRSITLSEEEMFPGTESAKKRVMDKGFAQIEFGKGPKRVVGGGGGNSEPWVVESKKDKERGTVEEVQHPNVDSDRVSSSKKLPAKGKGKEEDVQYPKLASSTRALTPKPKVSKVSPTKAPPKSLGKPSPKEPTSPKRPTFSKKSIFSGPLPTTSTKRPLDEDCIDPITLSNKRIKYQDAEPEAALDESIQDYLDSLDAGRDDPAYDTDEIDARRVFGVDDPFDEDVPTNKDSNEAMQMDEPAEVRQFERLPESKTELAKTAASVHKHEKREAADYQSQSEEARFYGLSRFVKKFLQPWRQDDHPDQGDLKVPKQGNIPVGNTSNGQITRFDKPSQAKPTSIANTPEAEDINDSEYPNSDTASTNPTSPSPPFTPRTPKPKYLPETEKHEAQPKQAKKPKPKTPSPKHHSPYGSPPPRFSVVPPTPPISSPFQGIDVEKERNGNGSTLPVPFAIPLTPPASRSSSTNPKMQTSTETPMKASKQQSAALATLDAVARRYEAAEVAVRKAREERDVILKEAKEEERKQREERLAVKFKMVEKQRERVTESSSDPMVVDSRLPTPPASSPPRNTSPPQASAPLGSSLRFSDGPPYGHFGLIPPEIANAPITYPPPKPSPKQKHKAQAQHTEKHTVQAKTPATSIKTRFHPGDPVFLFGETRYLTALKSRQIEKDLA